MGGQIWVSGKGLWEEPEGRVGAGSNMNEHLWASRTSFAFIISLRSRATPKLWLPLPLTKEMLMLPSLEHLQMILEALLQKQREVLGTCPISWVTFLVQRLRLLSLLFPPESQRDRPANAV